MKLRYWGHSCFELEGKSGLRVVLDPYKVEPGAFPFAYPPLKLTADLVTVSHNHMDHAGIAAVDGSPTIVRESGPFTFKELTGLGIASEHDPDGGRQRGPNVIFRLELDGVRLAHFGDFGQAALRPEQEAQLLNLDLLLLPVGGNYTMDGFAAAEIVKRLQPRLVIPMHYKTPGAGFVGPVEDFLAHFPQAQRASSPRLQVDPTLYTPVSILVLPYAESP